ncbi:hypothetical protein V7S57_02325 [Caulobacter sp. CCNWLY153]|uniref:hypothetical protein n=1 Tax=unclassified Caulobacter TaxID=2648921 RepID=UPI002FF30C27
MARGRQPNLLDLMGAGAYPAQPGHKARATSAEAARGIAPRVKSLRERVLDAIKVRPGTPEQIAHRIGEPLMNVRPRCSELARQGLIRDSQARADAMGGRKAIVWMAVVQ